MKFCHDCREPASCCTCPTPGQEKIPEPEFNVTMVPTGTDDFANAARALLRRMVKDGCSYALREELQNPSHDVDGYRDMVKYALGEGPLRSHETRETADRMNWCVKCHDIGVVPGITRERGSHTYQCMKRCDCPAGISYAGAFERGGTVTISAKESSDGTGTWRAAARGR